MNEFKPGSIEHRKKVAEKYHLTEQEVIDMSEEKFMVFCTGLEIGEKYGGLRATYSLLKNPDPHQVIDMIYALDEEGRNMVLDEFCEPVKESVICNCTTCRYKDTPPEDEPCCLCKKSAEIFALWTEKEADDENNGTDTGAV